MSTGRVDLMTSGSKVSVVRSCMVGLLTLVLSAEDVPRDHEQETPLETGRSVEG